MQHARPLLVVVSGLPATGKTTLARALAAQLGWPLFDKDSFKELLFDAAGDAPLSKDASRTLGKQAMELLFAVAGELGRAGVSSIMEAYFWPELAASELAPLGQWAQLVQVHCSASDELVIARYEERFVRGERHMVHLDGEKLGKINPAHRVAIPLDAPLIEVNSEDGFVPDLNEISARIRMLGGTADR